MVVGSLRQETELAIIGAGPGGYVAAIRAADLGKEVVLIEEREQLGGVCLLEGCIPSKTLINAVELANSAREAGKIGLTFEGLKIDPVALRAWTDSVVGGLSSGVGALLKRRGVEVIKGRARFENNHSLSIEGADVSRIDFKECIIATGSRVNRLPAFYDLPVWTSTEALKLPEIPERLLVVGGGYIGLELGLVYAGLGSLVTMIQRGAQLLKETDQDLVEVVLKHCEQRFEHLWLDTQISSIEKASGGYHIKLDRKGTGLELEPNQILVAVGRRPNTDNIALENAGITTTKDGRIPVNQECRTSEGHIFAIGDVSPGPMLAHKASREARVAAEVIAGKPAAFDNRAIPAVVFTDPEIAWTGITENEAKEQGIKFHLGRFPLKALGRARTLGRTDGFVKIISEPDSGLILGVSMVGPHASELIAEGTLALEMGATLEDLMATIHPHPTMSEAIVEAAEVAAGSAVHINPVETGPGPG